MASRERKAEVERLLSVVALDWEMRLARFFVLGALVCGLIGLIVGIFGQTWKLGVTGWFTGGTLLAVLSLLLLADVYVAIRRRQPS